MSLEALLKGYEGKENPIQKLVNTFYSVDTAFHNIRVNFLPETEKHRVSTKLDSTRELIEELKKLINKDAKQQLELGGLDLTEANKTFDSLVGSDIEEEVFLQALLDFEFESVWKKSKESSSNAEELADQKLISEFLKFEKAYTSSESDSTSIKTIPDDSSLNSSDEERWVGNETKVGEEGALEKAWKSAKGQVPHRINTSMSDEDFNSLKDHAKRNDVEGFIKTYKTQHPELSDNDVVSLALMRAVGTWDISLPSKVLKVLYKNNSSTPEPLVTLDKEGKNAILYALEGGTCTQQLSGYIAGLTESSKANEKFVLNKDLLNKIAYALQHPKSGSHPKILIRKLIEPIYTKESIDELIDIIGQEWLDSYYI